MAIAIASGDIRKPVSVDLTGLDANAKYFFHVLVSGPGVPDTTIPLLAANDLSFTTANIAPVAVADAVNINQQQAVSVAVLANDSDGDGDVLGVSAITVEPRSGTALINGKIIVYTPGADFAGVDTFTYEVSDGFGGSATAVVTVTDLRAAATGQHSALVSDADGKSVGLVRIDAMPDGSFTGRLELKGQRYKLLGRFDAAGQFIGTARTDEGTVGVELNVSVEGDVATLTGSFENGRWSASTALNQVSTDRQTELQGRYSVVLPAGPSPGATTGAAATDAIAAAASSTGDGWLVIKLGDNGEARIKGKTSEGDPFSAKALLGGTSSATTLLVYAQARGGQLVGELTLGSTVGGTLSWLKKGDDLSIAATGAPYIAPQSGERVFDTAASGAKLGTVTVSGGNLPSLSHALRFSRDREIQILDVGYDGFSIKQDVNSGIFQGRFRDPNNQDRRINFSGIMLRDQRLGRGVFAGDKISGRVEIVGTADVAPATDPATGDGQAP